MRLTTALGALALAGAIASGAMAQAPREVTANGFGSIEYRANYAQARYTLHLEQANTLPALEPQLDAIVGSEALTSLVNRRVYPTTNEESRNWLQELFTDWDNDERYSTAFEINIEGTENDLRTFEQGLSAIGAIYRRTYLSFRLPSETDIRLQAIRSAEINSRAIAELTANAFGCRVGELIRIQSGEELSHALEDDCTLHIGFSDHDETETDPFLTEAQVSITATYETLCPAED